MRRFAMAVLGLALLAGGMTARAQKDPDVGEVAMSEKKKLLDNLGSSPIHQRLMGAIKLAGLQDTLSGSGPFTLFAPTDDAFAKLAAGTLTRLQQPENKEELTHLLQYHVVAGKLTTKKLNKAIKKGKGSTKLTTLDGGLLTVTRSGSILTLTDAKGGTAVLTTWDVSGKNGTMHVIDAVLMPR